VLLEKPGRHPGQVTGRSPYLQPVNIDTDAERIGEIVPVRVTEVGPNSLFGVIETSRQAHRAFSSEVDTGSREENASKHNDRAPLLIPSEAEGF